MSGELPLHRKAQVQFGQVEKAVNLAYTPEAKIGDFVLVHVGFAISIISQPEAHHILDSLASVAGEDHD